MKMFNLITLMKHKKKLLRSFLMVALVMVSVLSAFPDVKSVYVTANAASKRKIPIYCVDTDAPKVAISFDAAWGASSLGRKKNSGFKGFLEYECYPVVGNSAA